MTLYRIKIHDLVGTQGTASRLSSFVFSVTCLILSTFSAHAGSPITFSGSIGLEARGFVNTPAYSDQLNGIQGSIESELSFEWQSVDGDYQASLTPFYRKDTEDDARSHLDLREGFWRHLSGDWELLIGIERVFWGVTESRHLVNIINQVDGVENIDEEDYLGQPMFNFGIQQDYGRFDIYLLPYFRERTFAGVNGRLRGPIVVDTQGVLYQSSDEENHLDLALRYSHYIDNWDFGLSLFHGTGREPVLLPNDSSDKLIPQYNLITQAGVDLQFTGDSWLWRLETIYREGHGSSFFAAVGGFEYTYYQIFDSNRDLGWLVEYLYDGRDEAAPTTTLQNDLFIGSRIAFNDVQDTSFLGGVLIDSEDYALGVRAEAQRRVGENWRLQIEAQWFTHSEAGTVTSALAADDFIQLNLKKFF